MQEPDVTLTDFALAALAFGFAGALAADGGVAALFAGVFAALGLAAFLGALSHGWFTDRGHGAGAAIWLATMLAMGLASAFLWLIAARLFGLAPWLGAAVAWGQFALLAGLAIFVTRNFFLASGFSLPPTLAVLAGFAWGGHWLGVAGLGLALAGAVQQALGIRGLGLSHNALYHVIQAAAFVLVFLAVPAVAGG